MVVVVVLSIAGIVGIPPARAATTYYYYYYDYYDDDYYYCNYYNVLLLLLPLLLRCSLFSVLCSLSLSLSIVRSPSL